LARVEVAPTDPFWGVRGPSVNTCRGFLIAFEAIYVMQL
jgi:hypothetical protein